MAVKKSSGVSTLSEARKEIDRLNTTLEKKEKEIAQLKRSAYCPKCKKLKVINADNFYLTTDPSFDSDAIIPFCKSCAEKIALREDSYGKLHTPTKESIKLALKYLNKPFIEKLFESSISESSNKAGRRKNNIWSAYIKNVAMQQYKGMTYLDSDMFKGLLSEIPFKYEDEKTEEDIMAGKEDQEMFSEFARNKKDVTRLLGYDPFEKESIADQPFLYSQLLGLLDSNDDDSNDDMLRTASAISIVRGFLQQSKIDDAIAAIMMDLADLHNNSATIKSLQDSKSKITSIIKDLAAESCISLKNNKITKKGSNTWTGKLKKLKELNLREAEVNGFDMATCRGMQQVQEISDASIMKQLALDESEWSDMVAEMRVMNQQLRKERDSYQEINRLLLRENIDLKDYLDEEEIDYKGNLQDLKQLYSVFSSDEESGDEDE